MITVWNSTRDMLPDCDKPVIAIDIYGQERIVMRKHKGEMDWYETVGGDKVYFDQIVFWRQG